MNRLRDEIKWFATEYRSAEWLIQDVEDVAECIPGAVKMVREAEERAGLVEVWD